MAEIEINDFFLSFGQYDVLCTSLNGWRCQHLAIGALHIWLSAMVILRILHCGKDNGESQYFVKINQILMVR